MRTIYLQAVTTPCPDCGYHIEKLVDDGAAAHWECAFCCYLLRTLTPVEEALRDAAPSYIL